MFWFNQMYGYLYFYFDVNSCDYYWILLDIGVGIFMLINGSQYPYEIKDFINLLEQASC